MKRTIAISLSSLLLLVNFFGLVAPGAVYAQGSIELRGTVIDDLPVMGRPNELSEVAGDLTSVPGEQDRLHV